MKMDFNAARSAALVLGVWILCGCGAAVDVPSTPPAPAHPAMTAPAGGKAPGGAMPPGHPAVPPAGAVPAPGSPGPAPAAPAAAPVPVAPSTPEGREVVVGPLSLTAPEGWIRQGVTSQFLNAQFQLPRAEGDPEDGRFTVSAAGGSVDANITRWQAQFKENPPVQSQPADIAGLKVTEARIAGTFAGGGGPVTGGGSGEKPGWKLWGAVIQVPGSEQLVFLKATGPAKTLDRWDGSFGEFLKTLKSGN